MEVFENWFLSGVLILFIVFALSVSLKNNQDIQLILEKINTLQKTCEGPLDSEDGED